MSSLEMAARDDLYLIAHKTCSRCKGSGKNLWIRRCPKCRGDHDVTLNMDGDILACGLNIGRVIDIGTDGDFIYCVCDTCHGEQRVALKLTLDLLAALVLEAFRATLLDPSRAPTPRIMEC